MEKNYFSPYVRVAMFSEIQAPFVINERVLYDYEIIFVRNGKCKLTVCGIEYICKRNDIIFIRPGVEHKLESYGDNVFDQPHIHFDVEYWDRSIETPVSFKNKSEMSVEEIQLIRADVLSDICIPCVFNAMEPEAFQKIFFDVIMMFQENGHGKDILLKAKMLELLDIVISQFEQKSVSSANDNVSPIVMVKDYIDNNFLQPLSLNQLSGTFHVNMYTLLRNFKRCYGISVMAYYNSKRCTYAKKMLLTTNLSVSTIGEQLNMVDVYSFSKFFKKYEGCSPREFRKNAEKRKRL